MVSHSALSKQSLACRSDPARNVFTWVASCESSSIVSITPCKDSASSICRTVRSMSCGSSSRPSTKSLVRDMFCVRYVCGVGRLLGLGVRDALAKHLTGRLPRRDDTDALRGAGGAAVMSDSESLSAAHVLSQCCIDGAQLVCASDCKDECERYVVEYDSCDRFEGEGDVRPVSG